MIMLQKIFEAVANFFSHGGLWILLWILVLLSLCFFLSRMKSIPKKSRPWIVRKGECPFCGSELFGTTRDYQRLHLLETLSPESKYLCTNCDRDKVADLLSKYRLGLADD
jgi:hypothetical protein